MSYDTIGTEQDSLDRQREWLEEADPCAEDILEEKNDFEVDFYFDNLDTNE
jgi:hypothetical protein